MKTGGNIFKGFVAGLAFPAIVLPLVYSIFVLRAPDLLPILIPIYFYPMFIPLFFGLANVIFLRYSKKFGKKHENMGLIITGLLLGLIVTWLKISTFLLFLFSVKEEHSYIILPVVYALVFRFIIKRINRFYGLSS